MTGRVFLHVGLPKSGTSYLQKLLSANRDALAHQAGVLFPGRSWSDQVVAVRDVRGLYEPRMRARVEGRWQRLVDEVGRWKGDAVISMEWLCAADGPQIERIVGSFVDREAHVVMTARDLARTLPAAWQEFMQNRQTWTWEEFLAGVQDPGSTTTGGRAFWSQQDLPALVERWSRHVGAAQVHLVTLPQPGADRDLLWHRFAGLLGIDPDQCTTQGLGGNESLGLESAELMRRLNMRLREERLGQGKYNSWFKHHLAKEVLAARRTRESALALPPEAQAWAHETALRHIEAVAATGVAVVGDLDELKPAPARDGRQPSEITDSELLDVALAALVDLGTRKTTDDNGSSSPPGLPSRSRRPRTAGPLARVRARLRSRG